jgi:hypothetical protein
MKAYSSNYSKLTTVTPPHCPCVPLFVQTTPLWSTDLVTAPGLRNTPSCERAVDATEANETIEPAGDKVDASGDVDEPSNIILSVSKNAGETEDTSVLTRVDVGDPSDEEVVDEFVVEPVKRINAQSDTIKAKIL